MKRYLLLLTFCGAASAQTIEGFVEDSATGLPLAGAHLTFGGPTVNDRYMAISDRAGHFWRVFPQAVRYNVVVSRAGYLTPEQPLSVTPGPESSNLRIPLTPQAVVSGKLEDDDGFPVGGARVEALRYEVVAASGNCAPPQRRQRPTISASTASRACRRAVIPSVRRLPATGIGTGATCPNTTKVRRNRPMAIRSGSPRARNGAASASP